MRRPDRAKPDINVTPLVDVVLVLLIIFMVVVPQMEAGAAVTVPGVLNPDPKTDMQTQPITLSMTASGRLYLEKQLMDRQEAFRILRELREESADRRILLKADREVRYAEVRSLFKETQEIGFAGVSLQVGERREDQDDTKRKK